VGHPDGGLADIEQRARASSITVRDFLSTGLGEFTDRLHLLKTIRQPFLRKARMPLSIFGHGTAEAREGIVGLAMIFSITSPLLASDAFKVSKLSSPSLIVA